MDPGGIAGAARARWSGPRSGWTPAGCAAAGPAPRYLEVAGRLFAAVARTSGQRVVDSSHYPMRARELQRLDGIELYLLFLVRDPEGVVASLGREDVPERRYGVLAANAYLWLTHLLAAWVYLRHPRGRRLFVRHEEFLAEPAAVVQRILLATGSQRRSRTCHSRPASPFRATA